MLFQLVENYRTHQGVVDVAHHAAILPLLTFFPYSIDKLQPERAVTTGQLPVFIVGSGGSGVAAAVAGRGIASSSSSNGGGGGSSSGGGSSGGGSSRSRSSFTPLQLLKVV